MAQPQMLQVKLSRFDAQPWGFRLQGGVDFAAPLLVQKVNGGSLAEQAGLLPGDAVIKINDVEVFNLRHKDAQDVVVRSGNNFVLTVQRGGSTWRPHVTPTGNVPQPNSPYLQTVTKTSLAHKQQDSQHIGCGYNNSARPFANGGDGSVKSIVNKQYNTPVGIYSDESIAETLSAQAEVLAGGVLGVNFKKNEKEYQADKSEVLKFLREEETGQSTPEPHSRDNFYWTQSHAIGGNERRTPIPKQFQQDERGIGPVAATQRPSLPQPQARAAATPTPAEHQQQADPRIIVMPVCPALQSDEYKAEMEAAAAALSSDNSVPATIGGHPACQLCGVSIVGVFVRIKDKNLHVECFKCATCGTSLKNQGYYNFNNKLYCDIHAKLAAMQNPPSGTEGYVPVPIKPNTKLSASTISSALSTHGFNGVSNGNTTPTPTPAPVANSKATTTIETSSSSINNDSNNNDNDNNFIVSNINNNNNNNNNNNMSSYTMAAEQSMYEQLNAPTNAASTAQSSQSHGDQDQPFEYVTLTGNVIRSVVPPGKGVNINYKVNQGYARPYGAAPPASAPKSPVSYPPQQQQQQWGAPQQQYQAPKPAGGNAYATLPRTNVGGGGQQDNDESLQRQYEEECYEEDIEVANVKRQCRMNFSWPPPRDDSESALTAAPLYIAPPETQHVVPKPLLEIPPLPPGAALHQQQKHHTQQQQQQQQQHDAQQLQQQQSHRAPHQQFEQLQTQWQSRSAPQLTKALQQQQELESSSDSYTSTSTTTTTTSEEYQRLYAAQLQAYQMQQACEQSGSELDYHMDIEMSTAMQQMQENDSYISSTDCLSGRRSAQECVDSLVAPLSTYKLIDMVREVTPSPVPQTSSQPSKHVVFIDEPEFDEHSHREQQLTAAKEAISEAVENIQSSEAHQMQEVQDYHQTDEQEDNGLIIEDRSHILESQRLFQPTPEIKIEIPPVRQIPPTKIPNPTPKEWINPMIKVLTTASEVPFHLVECPFPKPCESKCEAEPAVQKKQTDNEIAAPAQAPLQQSVESQALSGPPPVSCEVLRESPPRGSFLSKAMSTAPEFTVRFTTPASQMVPLPEETDPYMPPPIDMKPYLREDYRPKSPFVSALTTAPERPFEGQFERDVPIHILDLPTPKEHLSMSDALCTAPQRAYTPLNAENALHKFEDQEKEKEKKKYEFQVLDHEEVAETLCEGPETVEYLKTEKRRDSERKSSAFAAMQAFQPSREPLTPTAPTTPKRASITSLTKNEPDLDYDKYCKAKERNQKRLDYFQKKEEEIQQQQQQIQQNAIETNNNDKCQESALYSYAKENASSNSSSTVQPMSTTTTTYASNTAQASRSSYLTAQVATAINTSKFDAHEIIEETAEELEHSEVLFPPPSPLSHLKGKAVSSGLHKPESIPKYQRNWTVLPTQSPIRTPEPQELRENVPLAFVDAPKAHSAIVTSDNSNNVYKPVAQLSSVTASQRQIQQQQTHQTMATAARTSISNTNTQTVASTQLKCNEQRQQQQQQQLLQSVPTNVEDRSGPVTMAFQSLDEYERPDQSQTPTRPFTPSLINKPAPVIPYYQTPEMLCFDECPATHARAYDMHSASPFADRARSPAPGPPPNPLSSIRAPRMKDSEPNQLMPRAPQTGSIMTGQSYLGAQQSQQQQQGQLISHSEATSQSAMQSFTQKPETIQEKRVGDLTIQRREQASHLEEQKQSQSQSQTKTQIGNTQIERRRKVTEEYEHSQSAKTIEIRTGGTQSQSTERRQSYGKTGYVANQARRLSGLEQEISNLTTQSQAISARAATLTTEGSFPQLKSPTPERKFPIKAILSSHGESQAPSYLFSATANNKMVGPPPGFQGQGQLKESTAYGASLVPLQQAKFQEQQQQQQQKTLSAFSSTSATSSSLLSSSSQANTVSCSLTKASATNNQANAASVISSSIATDVGNAAKAGICPVTGTFCRPGHTCCKQQFLQSLPTPSVGNNNNQNNNKNNSNNNAYRPNASAGLTGFKPTQAVTPATAAAAAATIAPPPPTVAKITANISDNSNVDDSAGAGGKGGAFGATSAPKRGRGIVNKAVGPGVRVPHCNSCNVQIRGPFITALGRIWCPDHFICVNGNCRRALQDIGFVEEKGDLYCEYCFEKYLAPTCSRCAGKIKGDCLNAIGKHFHPECFTCAQCGKVFGNTPFFLEDGNAYCEADWNELFTTKCFACGFPVEAGDRWVEALNHNYHSQCFNCTYCKQNLEGQSFYNKGGRPFCKNHAR